jgi:2,3-diaminopropionate biosynthesis protein SbnA
LKCRDVTEAIGRTPLVRLLRLPDERCAGIYLKLEGLNPTGSVKARTALGIVLDAERTGRLRQGGTIVESSSGNLGIALAMIAAARGYRAIIVTDEQVNQVNLAMMRAYGAEVVIAEGWDARGGYQQKRLDTARRIAWETPGAILCYQYTNPANPRAHYATTAQELLADLRQFDCLVVAVSTGGQITGIGSRVREAQPGVQIVAVDSQGSAIFGGKPEPQLIRGVGLPWKPSNLDLGLVDESYKVGDEDACIAARVLARTEGIMCGGSSGMVLLVALRKARELGPNHSVVAVMADRGEKYFDQIFNDAWMEEHGFTVAASPGLLYERAGCLAPVQKIGA